MEFKIGGTVGDPGKPLFKISENVKGSSPQAYPTQAKEQNARLQKYALPYDTNVEDYMANNQGKWELLGKAGAGVLSEAVLGTLEGGSYLLDFEQMVDKMKGAEEEYTNWFADAMKEAKGTVSEDLAKVYQTKDAQEGFAPGDATWWAKHTPQTIGTALGLMIPAAGVAGVAGKVGKLLGASSQGINFAKGLSATIASRYAESTMEANGVYETALAKGATPEDAGKAASKAWNTNWIFALQDFMQYNSLLKGFGSAAKGKLGKSILEAGKQVVSESAEEAGQFITAEEAVRTALDPEADYFGAGFSKRLSDYVRDPEFQASAFLGGVGGGVFAAAGGLGRKTEQATGNLTEWFNKSIQNNSKDGLQKEAANYVGDTATSSYIDDKGFVSQMDFHKKRGTLNVLKANYEALEKDTNALPETREFIRNKIEDLDFVMSEEARLKTSTVPPILHDKLIFTGLEQKQQARLSNMLDKEVETLYQDAMKEKQLEPALLEMKKLQTSLKGYEKLAETQPQFKPQVVALQQQLAEATNMLKISHPDKSVDEVLATTKDDQLFQKAFQLVSTNEKMKLLKNDIAALTTKEGLAKAAAEEAGKQAIKKIETIIQSPNVTKGQLEALKATTKDPTTLNLINAKIKELNDAVKDKNKESVTNKVNEASSELTTPTQQTPGLPVSPGEVQPGDSFSNEAPEYEEFFDPEAVSDPEAPELPTDPFEGLDPSKLAKFGQKSTGKTTVPQKDVPLLERLESEGKKDAPKAPKVTKEKNVKVRNEQLEKVTIKSWLKEFAGKWERLGNDLFWRPEVDVNGYPVEQTYYNEKNEKVKIQEVFASDANGVLLINTPLVKDGDTVVLKVENEYPYTYTEGYKPNDEVAHQIINIYWADDKGVIKDPKPLAQLDAGDNNFMSAERKQINMDLRKAVIANNGILKTTIAAKNIGVPKRSASTLSSLSILEFDYWNDKFQKLGFNPIFGFLDRNKNIEFSGDTYAKAPKEYQEALQLMQFVTDPGSLGNIGGSIVVGRMSPNGSLRMEILQGRKLNEQERTKTIETLISAFRKTKNYSDIADLIHLTTATGGIYKAKDTQGRNKTPDLFTMPKQVTRVNDQLLIPIQGNAWVVFEKDQVVNFLQGKPAKGKTHAYSKGTITSSPTKVDIAGDLLNEAKVSFDKYLSERQRNINKNRLNSELEFTDPATGIKHKNYYEFLRDTASLQTNLRGSNTAAYGQDNSYSYGSTTLYLNPVVSEPKVTVNQETQTVTTATPTKSLLTGVALPSLGVAPSLEAQKADIERRRKEELGKNRGARLAKEGDTAYTDDGRKVVRGRSNRDRYGRGTDTYTVDGVSTLIDFKRISQHDKKSSAIIYADNVVDPKSINAKYDAELAALQPETPKVESPKVDPKDALKKKFGSKFKPATGEVSTTLGPKEIQWFKDNFGDEHLEIMKGVNSFMSVNGVHAFGMYHNALVTLAEFSPAGTAYHEAGHFVFDPKNGLISPILRERILKEAVSVYGKKSESELEEKLMEDFEKYKLSNGKILPQVTKAQGFFARLLTFMKNLIGYKSPIQKLYEQIDTPNLTLEQRRKLQENRHSLVDEADTKYKLLPGFFNRSHEEEALLSFRTEVVETARVAAGKLAKVSGFLTNQESLDALINSIRGKYLDDFRRISEIPADVRTESDVIRLHTYYAMGLPTNIGLSVEAGFETSVGTWEDSQETGFREKGFKNKLIDSFTELGYAVRYDLDIQEIHQEDEGERIFDLDQSLVNPSASISERVKLFLHSIPRPVIRNGEVVDTEKTILGTPNPLEFRAVDAMLSLKLADAINPYTRLIQLAETDIISKIILDELEKIKITDPQVFTEVLVKYRRDTMEKKSILLREKEEFIEIEDRDEDEVKRGLTTRKVHSAQFIDANRNSVFRVILDDWRAEGVRVNLITPTGTLTTKVDKIRRDFDALKTKHTTKALPFEELKKEFVTLLAQVGVTLPKGVLQEMSEVKPWIKKETLQKQERSNRLNNLIFDTKRASFESMLVGMEDGKDPYKNELLTSLAKSSAVYNDSVKTGAYLNENGDLEYPINTPSFLSELFNSISTKEGALEYVETKEQDDFFKGNAILQLIKDDKVRDKIKLSFLSAIRDRDKDPKMFAERTEIDSIVSRLTAFVGNTQDGGKESNFGAIFIGTPSDKGKNPMMSLPKKKAADARSFFFNVLKNTVANEVVRIQNINQAIGIRERYDVLKVKAQFKTLTPEEEVEYNEIKSVGEQLLPTDVKNLKATAKFKYIEALNQFPELAASVEQGEISPEELVSVQAKADEVINKFIDEQYQNFVAFMLKNDMIKVSTTKNGTTISNKRIPKGLKDLTTPAKTEEFLKEFFFNDTAYRLEMSKLFMGDMALYSSDEDYFKRAYQLVTPGYKGFSEEDVNITRGVYPEQFKPAVNQTEIKSLIDLGLPKEIADMYLNANKGQGINKTDAQSLATITGYRKIAKSLGLWNDTTHEVLYQMAWSKGITARRAIQDALNAKQITEEEAKQLRGIARNTTLQPLKPFQYQTLEVKLPSDKTILVNVQFKDSITPIIPELIASHQGYSDLHAYMENNGFDIMSAADTVKVGLHGVVDFTKPAEEWQKQKTDLSNIRFPQILPSASKEEVSGTQFHKLIMGDIIDGSKYTVGGKTISGAALKELYNELWMEKLANSSARLQEKLGMGADFKFSENPAKQREQFERLKAILEEELASRELNDNYQDAIDLVRTQDGKVGFNIPLSFPQLGEKFQGILTNLFKKRIIKQKSPGYSAVNLADFGVGRTDELKYIRNEEGNLIEAEVGLALPSKVVRDLGLKYAEHIDPKTNRLYWEKLNENQKKALQMIIYRIPTSNKSSMLPVRVAMILPETLNNVVMIPGELTTQMGLDFDVDKSQLLARVLTKPEEEGLRAIPDKANVDNKLFDLYWSILTSTEHLGAMLTPLSTARLEAIKDNYTKLGLYNQSAKSPVYTIQSDVATESKNREEKAKVGISSRAATAHSVLQMIPKDLINSFVTFSVSYNGKTGKTLGNMEDMNGGLISENLGEVQQAALDAAKTPLLAIFNITKNLLAPAETMLMFGYPLDVVTNFFMQPVVAEWINMYNQEKQNENRATERFLAKHGEIKKYSNMISSQKIERTFTNTDLYNNLTGAVGDNAELDAKIFHELSYLLRIGRQMGALTNILSLDTMNDASSMEKLITIQQQVGDATNPQNDISLDARIFNVAESPVITKRIAGFYNYMVKDALDFTSQLYPVLSAPYVAGRNYVIDKLNLRKTNDAILKQVDQFIHYYSLQHDGLLGRALGSVHPLKEKGLGNPANLKAFRWSFTRPGEGITDYFSNFMKKAEKTHPALLENELIKALRIQNTTTDGISILGVKNTGDDNKTGLINGWRDLFNAESEDIRVLAHDLAYYAIRTSGFTYTPYSFADLIPTEYWISTGLNNAWKNVPDLDNPGLLANFARHKFDKIDTFPQFYLGSNSTSESILKSSIKKNKSGVIESFAVDKKYAEKVLSLPAFVIVKDNLYEQSPDNSSLYKKVQPAGNMFFFETSVDGRNASALPEHKDEGSPNPWKVKPAATQTHNLLSDVPNGNNEFIREYLPENKNTPETVLEKLISEETNPEVKAGLEAMKRNVHKITTPIEVVETPGKLGVFEVTKDVEGLRTVIKVNPDANVESASQMRQVITHELHHAFSVAVLQNPVGDREINFNRNVERLQKEAKEKLGNVQGTQDKFEFIAELASNKDFRAKLKKTDLWSRILRAIRKVLGMTDSYDKLLDQYYGVLDNAEDLQKFTPGEFALEQEKKERPAGKKKLTVFEEMISSLEARLKNLRTKGKKVESFELSAALKTLKKTVSTNKNAAIIRYLILVNDEVSALKKAYAVMAKTPSKINPSVLNPMRDQLLSYSILDTFATQIRSNPEDFVPKGGDPDQLLKQLSTLRDEIFKLTQDTKKLAIQRVAASIKEKMPNEDFDKLVENLTVADRDITWWSRWQTSFSDIEDPIIRGMALKLKDNANEAYRKTQEQLYKGDVKTKVTASVATLETSDEGVSRWSKLPVTFETVGTFKALKDYEVWLKKEGKSTETFRDKFNPVLDQTSFREGSEGVMFISPFSKEGKRIRKIAENSPDYPLRQFYETVVLSYLKAQEQIKLPSQRPGLRVPTIKRTLMEGFAREKGIKDTTNMLGEQFIDNFIERFDDSEYQQVNQHGEPKTGLALRYTAKQDGENGRLTPKEVSLDIASTTTLFTHEMNKRQGLLDLQDDVELATQALAEREVMRHQAIKGKGLTPYLTNETEGIVMSDGRFETFSGVESKAYQAMRDLQNRELYGIVKKRQGDVAMGSKKVSVSKTVDAFLKFTGLRIMFGAVAIPLTNLLVGELTMMKEVVGGNLLNTSDYKAGQKLYAQSALATLSDLGRREKLTHFGKLFTFFNPMETMRPVDSIGLDTTRMRTIWDKIISTGGSTIEYKLAVTSFGAVMNKFKAQNPEGEQTSLYDAVDISSDGKITLKKGYKYLGKNGTQFEKPKSSLSPADINEINQYTLKTYQIMNGIYNTSDKPAAHADVVGRLVNFMRSWLAPGIAARWNTKRFDNKLNQLNEGHYVSSLVAFNNIYGRDGFLLGTLKNLKMLMWMQETDEKMLLLPNELELSEEEQADIINLRKANMRKTLFELYTIAALGLLIFAGFDEDDDDSYVKYMAARIRREMMTFIDPTTAWDVLRSPTIALNTVEAAGNLISTGLDAGWNFISGEEQEVMQRGPGKDEYKLLYKAKKFWGLNAEYQFDDLDTKTRFVLKGGFK